MCLYRFDYEEVDLDAAVEMMLDLELMISDKAFIGQIFTVGGKKFQVETADNFEYSDPVDGTISRNQVKHVDYTYILNLILLYYIANIHDF